MKIRPLRTLLLLLVLLGAGVVAYVFWSPGQDVTEGLHDLHANGIWIQHGWLGDADWFQRNHRDPARFNDPEEVADLAAMFRDHHIRYVFPHLCPTRGTGEIPGIDAEKTERFLDEMGDIQVLPWIGGQRNGHCDPSSKDWRDRFIGTTVSMLQAHPRLAGVQVNIEPMPSGDPDFLLLLKELKAALPVDKMLSVAAYPPPTIWQKDPGKDLHWDEAYYRAIGAVVDQIVPMMYDTGLHKPKFYEQVMRNWTGDILTWSRPAKVLLGVPAYGAEDAEAARYHDPKVENLKYSLRGIHAGLEASSMGTLPDTYGGVAIYCEWEMDELEWAEFRARFLKRSASRKP